MKNKITRLWKPKDLEWYWYVSTSWMTVRGTMFVREIHPLIPSMHATRVKHDNAFLTYKEAQIKLRQIKRILKER